MVWFYVDDGFYRGKKVRRLGADRLPAVGLWLLCGDWSADNLTDGFMPWEEIERWDADRHLSKRLCDVALWEEAEVDDEAGIQFHNWSKWQKTKADVLAERAANNRKTAMYRDPELVAAVRKRDQDRCRFCGTLGAWRDRRSEQGLTYTYLEPNGPTAALNVALNVVVACRGCSRRKGDLSPTEAGLTLLAPGSLGGPSPAVFPSNQVGTSTYPDTDQIHTGTEPEFFKSPSLPSPSLSSGYVPAESTETLPRKTSRGAPRGTRLPDDFAVTAAMVEWARQHAPHVDGRIETEQFCDYWRSKAGRDATKLDWIATWRAWMRKAEQQAGRPRKAAGPTDADWDALK